MAILHIQLLGEFRILYDDVPVTTLNSARLQSLLTYLLLHRNAPQSRQHLAFLFWPDSTEKQARTNLRHQFHLLRQAHSIFEPLLLGDAQSVQWESALPLQLDVADFEAASGSAASLQELQNAVELYQGDLLPSCYDDWILPLRERLRQRFLESVERLIGILEQSGDYSGAIRYAERLNRFDPLYEATYRQLMRLYATSGDQAAIERVYQRCVALMQRELATLPTPATQQLYRQLIGLETPLQERHNLVASLTPFVGRETELTKLTTLLADPACRMVTILGTGGIGKTRLALEVAQRQIGRFLHGIYVVSLAAVSAPEFMVSTLADQLKFTFNGPQEPSVQLLNYLREKELLLVLDSIEHLLAGSDLLVKILQQAPAVKLLITSRERLKLAGEWLYEIHGLAVPQLAEVAEGEAYAAVQLFAQNARRVQVDFALDTTTRPAVVRLCQLVEGMPLALELAASWVRLLTCAEIVQELTQNLDLLTTSAPTGLERHRNMRAVFDHSWDLLTPGEQQVFRRLAVFQGGFRREAANQVAGASLALLAGLVDKSLLRWNRQGRYDMHELIRQYADEKLTEVATEKETTQDRHGYYYLEFLRQQEPRLKNNQQQQAMEEIRAEIDNIRLACRRTSAQGWAKGMGQAAQGLLLFYDAQNWYYEAETLFRQVAEELEKKLLDEDLSEVGLIQGLHISFGQVLAQQGWSSLRLGFHGKAKEIFQKSLDLLRRFGPSVELANTLHYFGVVAWLKGDYIEAQLHLQEGLDIYNKYNVQVGVAHCVATLGLVEQSLGHYEKALQLLQQGVAMFKEVGYLRLAAMGLSFLGNAFSQIGEYTKATQLLRESLSISVETNDRWSMAVSFNYLGAVIYKGGSSEWIEVKHLHEQSLAIYQELGDRFESAISLNYLGNVAQSMLDYPLSKRYFLSALQNAIEGQTPPVALDALAGLASLWIHQPDEETKQTPLEAKVESLVVLSLVLHHPATTQETKVKAQSLWNELATMLTSAQLVVVQERGHARTLEEVAAELLA